ncbi:alanine racemase [Tichowtungia aerotolerans]|uniref:Alanine racemase n=1 Tax=Tichowtungia aerotolerans TaxID=2697043 RepID=A0A6P1M0L0_9BACT|nr:alanine racemase [Tichowtungia aerotolerans]QHI68329.1 alanine racemase [Tichowtungia aerotolerans]
MNHSWVEINLGQLRKNIRSIRSAVNPGPEIIFVVKADAYGHGLLPIAQAASEESVRWFTVAYLDSAIALREILPEAHLLVMGYIDPQQIDLLFENRILPIITDLEHGLALASEARSRRKVLDVHLKIDTGMGRLGVQWDDVAGAMEKLNSAGGLNVTGVCSHFAKVEPNAPVDATLQAERFKVAMECVPPTAFKHLSSSRAALYFPEWDFDGVRQGIDLYGYGAADPAGRFLTSPILEWKTRVVQVKSVPPGFPVGYYGTHTTEYPTQIATVAVGYADGYNRSLSNRGDVLIGGRRCAVVGRVSMNWITVDVGPDANVKVGDVVTLIGRQGEEAIWASELSQICRTIPYEILTSINSSLKRKYIEQ